MGAINNPSLQQQLVDAQVRGERTHRGYTDPMDFDIRRSLCDLQRIRQFEPFFYELVTDHVMNNPEMQRAVGEEMLQLITDPAMQRCTGMNIINRDAFEEAQEFTSEAQNHARSDNNEHEHARFNIKSEAPTRVSSLILTFLSICIMIA